MLQWIQEGGAFSCTGFEVSYVKFYEAEMSVGGIKAYKSRKTNGQY